MCEEYKPCHGVEGVLAGRRRIGSANAQGLFARIELEFSLSALKAGARLLSGEVNWKMARLCARVGDVTTWQRSWSRFKMEDLITLMK